jgi:hypothetical protein
MEIVDAILIILEEPQTPKGYRFLANALKKMGRSHEAEAVELLFNDKRTNLDQKQSKDSL